MAGGGATAPLAPLNPPLYTYHIRSAIFDGENIDGQHLRPPVLAILLETIERENFDGLPA